MALRDTLRAASDSEAEARRRGDRVRGFVAAAASEGRLIPPPGPPRGVYIGGDGGPYPIYVPGPVGTPGPTAARGLLLDPEALTDLAIRTVRDVAGPSGLRWTLRDAAGTAVAVSPGIADGPPPLRSDFPGRFPALTLELLPPPSGTVQSFFASPRSLYLYALLLVIGILAGGLALTVRSLSHQLELARMQSDFVSTVSHELKSPLTSIRQLSEMLQAGRVPSAERRQKYFDVLVEQSERLTTLIDRVLDFARLEDGGAELDLVETDLTELLGDVIAGVQERVRHEHFVVRSEFEPGLPAVLLDPDAIALAATNVIDNGIKYSGDSREVIVRTAAENGDAVITVEDFGIGLDPDEMDRVFQRFYRGGDALTRSVKGTGLGLTLVKEIVEAHGGSVSARGEPGSGSLFTLRLPLGGP
jgi:signal transduction histidine kinase